MISNRTKKPITVQPDQAALLSSSPIRYSPLNHFLLRTDITTSVVFTQLEYLWQGRVNKLQATKDTKVALAKSYTRLKDSYFQWMSRRNLISIIKELEQTGILRIDRSKKRSNDYSLAEWSRDYLEAVSRQITFDTKAFIMVFPQLANLNVNGVKLGLVCAILLQRIHYMSRENGLIVISQANICKYMFGCVSLKTIQRSIKKMVALHILVIDHDDDEAATIYGIDYEKLQSHFSTESVSEVVVEFNEDQSSALQFAGNN